MTHLILLLIIIGFPIALIVYLISYFSKKSTSKNDTSKVSVADELERLHALKEKGIITQEEFENKKSKLI